MAEVSVIMSTYKEDINVLKEAVNSILNQTFKNFEFIIILDFPDNLEIKKLIEGYQEQDPRIKFYINEKNLGLAESLNRAIDLASGKYICRMDADDVAIVDRLEKQKNYLEANHLDLIGGYTEVIREDGQSMYSVTSIPISPIKIKKCLAYNNCLPHPTWFGKKEIFQLKYRNIPLCEDYDLQLRASLNNYRLGNIDEVVLKYRMTSNSLSRTNLYEQYLYQVYITKMYKQNKIADIEETKQYVTSKNTTSKAKAYSDANVLFNTLLENLRKKHLVSFVKNGFKLLFKSRDYLNKIWRMTYVALNK